MGVAVFDVPAAPVIAPADFVTSAWLQQKVGLCAHTFSRDRRLGILAKGHRRAGVRGVCLTTKEARHYLAQKGLKHLIREIGL